MSTKKRLGEILLESGVIDEAMLQSALGHQRRWGGRLGQALLDLKLVAEPVIVEALSHKLGIEAARLAELEPYALEQALRLVPREFAQRNNVFPMAADTSTITVAMSDPTNLALSDELRFRTGRRVRVCLGGDREVAEAIRTHYPQEYQAPEAIALEPEPTGEGMTLADPFEGGTAEDMRAMLEPTRHAPARATPAPPPPPVASAAPMPLRPAVAPPPPPVQSVAPTAPAAPRPPAPTAPPATAPAGAPSRPAQTIPPSAARPAYTAPPGTAPTAPPPARPAAAPAPVTAPTSPPVAPSAGAAPHLAAPSRPAVPPAAPPAAHAAAPTAPAAPPAAALAAEAPLDAMFGAIPRGGFAPEEPYEELTPAPLDESEPISADLLAPEEEMVEGRVPVRELTPAEVKVLDALEQLALGVDDPTSPLRPGQVAAALLRLLLEKRLVSEQELLDQLIRR